MYLCTCIKVVVTTLPKFSRENTEKILLNFWNWGKNIKPSKKFLCKNLRLNMYNEFLASLRNHASKKTKDHYLSKSQKDSNAILFEESNSLLQFIPSKKKSSSGHAESSCDHLSKNFLSKFWKPFARVPEMIINLGQQSCFSPKRSSNMHNEVLASLA